MKIALRVVIQFLLLVGFWAPIRDLAAFAVPLLDSGSRAVPRGWLSAEGRALRLVSGISPETVLVRLDPLVSALSWILAPIALPIRVLFRARADERKEGPASDEDVQAYIDVGREEGILEGDDEKLLQSIVDFGETMVKEVMTPRTDIAAVEESATIEGVADFFIETKYSRLPVYRGTIDQIVGIVHVKDVFEAVRRGSRPGLAAVARAATFVPETKRTAELLREFQRRRLAMTIVVDEYGSVAGLVTIEDLLEEIAARSPTSTRTSGTRS